MNILILTVGGIDEGSTQYRIGQYLPLLQRSGMSCTLVRREEIGPETVRLAAEADMVVNQKCLFRNALARAIVANSRAVLFDFDDAIHTRPGKPYGALTRLRLHLRLRFWLRAATVVTPANGHLAAYARQHSRCVRVLPMALDTTIWRPARTPAPGLNIGWAGSPGTLPYLEALNPVLARLQAELPEARLRVYCGRRPALACPHEHVPYAPGTEPDFIRTLHVGLLPLPNSEHARGKSPIKSLQYLACGVPVVGNVVGATAEICRPAFSCAVNALDAWLPTLAELAREPERRAAMGAQGRAFIEETHSLELCGRLLIALLTAAASGHPLPMNESP